MNKTQKTKLTRLLATMTQGGAIMHMFGLYPGMTMNHSELKGCGIADPGRVISYLREDGNMIKTVYTSPKRKVMGQGHFRDVHWEFCKTDVITDACHYNGTYVITGLGGAMMKKEASPIITVDFEKKTSGRRKLAAA